jgi:uncharacterized protein with GYD domain
VARADAAAIRWSDESNRRYLMIAPDCLPQHMIDDERCIATGRCACDQPRRGWHESRLANGGGRRSIPRVVAQANFFAARRGAPQSRAAVVRHRQPRPVHWRRSRTAPGSRARPGGSACGSPTARRRRVTMITYIGLLSFTEKGVQSIKDTTKRAAAAKEAAKRFGVNMRDIYWTMGTYDIVCVLEAEDEQALTAFNLATAMQGNVRTHSLRAFSAGEVDKILAKLP